MENRTTSTAPRTTSCYRTHRDTRALLVATTTRISICTERVTHPTGTVGRQGTMSTFSETPSSTQTGITTSCGVRPLLVRILAATFRLRTTTTPYTLRMIAIKLDIMMTI